VAYKVADTGISIDLQMRSKLKCIGKKMLAPSARPHPALRATFPLEGEGFFRLYQTFLFYFSISLQSHLQIGAVSNSFEPPQSLPLRGEGGAKRRMRAGGRY